MALIDPPRWSELEFDRERLKAIEFFRDKRLTEPVERYFKAFDDYAASVDRSLATTSVVRPESPAGRNCLAAAAGT